MLSHREKSLLDALEPGAEEQGIEIVTLEIVGSKKSPTIRIYIDGPDGVTFDVLAAAQQWIGDLMDEIDPFPGAYLLEVSSPGIDRPLRTPDHFRRFAGETAVVKLTGPQDGRSNWTGILQGFEDGAVVLDVDGQTVRLPYETIKKAHVKGTVDFGSRERK